MRIIAGIKKGKKLFTPKGDNVRPTTDRTREALYSILFARLKKEFSAYRVLDIFSGTGAFGLEALSRGAKEVCFVDIDLSLTKKNVELCGFSNVSFIRSDARKIGKANEVFDLVFMDAPYNKGLSEEVLSNLYDKGYLGEDSIIIVEVARDEKIVIDDRFVLEDERVYGAAKVLFLAKV